MTDDSIVTMKNVILYGQRSASVVYGDSSTLLDQAFSNVYNDTGGTTISGTNDNTGVNGNLAVDPLFNALSDDSDVSNDDWGLGTGSPCIDAGFPQSSHNDADGTPNDMGAFGGPNSEWEN